MSLSWGHDLWDRLDNIIVYSTASSLLIEKSNKCFMECHNVWTKAAHKQKRLLERLQTEIRDANLEEFTLTQCLTSVINNFISICNIESTFHNSVAKASDDYLKKAMAHIKKECNSWCNEKRKNEDSFERERRRYDMALRRYRDKHQAVLIANENFNKSDEMRSISQSQVDMCQNILMMKRNEYDESKREYFMETKSFNRFQQAYFQSFVVKWAQNGEKLYEQKLALLKDVLIEFAKYTKEMIKNLNYSSDRFLDSGKGLSFEKDAILLVQKYKTGDVHPGELQYIDLDVRQYLSRDSELIQDSNIESPGSDSNDGSPEQDRTGIHGNLKESPFSGSYSSMRVADNTVRDIYRLRVQNMKVRQVSKLLNPAPRVSLSKCPDIFRSATPWNDRPASTKSTNKQKSFYKKRGRAPVQGTDRQRRSHSVSDLISNVLSSSFHCKATNKSTNDNNTKETHSSEAAMKQLDRTATSDFDTDTSDECLEVRIVPEIVSTPAEAVGLASRKYSAPDSIIPDSVYEPVDQTDDNNHYEYGYVGSCVSMHDFTSENHSNGYLSFKCGDQFYILTMDEGSGWLFVEIVGQTVRGFVPASYMEIQRFDHLSGDVI